MKQAQKGYFGLILLIILAVAIGGGAYYFSKQNKSIDQGQVSSTDSTSNWETYTNEKYGFSFKYPADILKDNSSSKTATDILKLTGSVETIVGDTTFRDNFIISTDSSFCDGEDTVLNNEPVVATTWDTDMGVKMYRKTVCFKNHNFLRITGLGISAESREMLEKVMATFTFTK